MTARRSIDTAPHPDLRWYSTGNFAEVAPARWSVMSWSLVGDPAERGLRAFTARLMPNARWATGTHYVFVGYFACRPYHNLSALCQIAHELPGPDDEDVTRAYFEGVPPPDRELGRHCSAVQRLLAVPRMAREFHRLRGRLAALEADVAICEEDFTTALQSGWGLALGRAAERALRVVDEASDLHYSTSGSLVPAGAVQRKVGERLLPRWGELEPLVNRPRELPWSRLFDAVGGPELEESRFLAAPFYEAADAFEPWTTYSRAFQPHAPHELGGRGPKQEEVADVVWQMYRGVRRVGIEQLSRAVGDTMQAREESKALMMRCLHLFRRALPALAGEAGVDGDGWAYLRIRELLSPVRRPQLEQLVAARRREVDEALTEDMPDELFAPRPADAGGPPRRRAVRQERTPSGVSPGVVAGMVATLDTAPAGSERNGDGPVILVCESADAGIQSLLPHVAGLITLRGSMLSHIATLAREFGVPTVVNHPLAETLRAGQHVVLNGSTGEVEVIA